MTRLSAAERHAASTAVLNQLADEVITSRIAVFDDKVARGWVPSQAEREQRDLDARLLHERADY